MERPPCIPGPARRPRWRASLRLVVLLTVSGCTSDLPTSTSRAPLPPAQAEISLSTAGGNIQGGGQGQDLQSALEGRRVEIEAKAAQSTRAEPFDGTVILVARPSLPAGELLDALDVATAAGWTQPWLAVVGPNGDRRGIALRAAAADHSRVIAAVHAELSREVGGYANPRVYLDPSVGYRVRVHDRVFDSGSGLELRCPSSPCGEGWPDLELNRLIRRLKLDHPRDRAVLLLPDPTVSVQRIVNALDQTRDDSPTGAGARSLLPVALIGRPEAFP